MKSNFYVKDDFDYHTLYNNWLKLYHYLECLADEGCIEDKTWSKMATLLADFKPILEEET